MSVMVVNLILVSAIKPLLNKNFSMNNHDADDLSSITPIFLSFKSSKRVISELLLKVWTDKPSDVTRISEYCSVRVSSRKIPYCFSSIR